DMGAFRSRGGWYRRSAGAAHALGAGQQRIRVARRRHPGKLSPHIHSHSHLPQDRKNNLETRPTHGCRQHAPTLLENGNVLIFDNGPHRLDDSVPYSRVIEVNPATNEIVWKYQDKPTWNFFSPRMGYAQRLANGNKLITESSFGRFFEVTKEGKIVWEYVNPFFGKPFFGGPPTSESNQVFRAIRYSEEEIARARG